MTLQDKFDPGWYRLLLPYLKSAEFQQIGMQLAKEAADGASITPLFDNTFRAFKECPYNKLKVVFLGLDPYPGEGVADGLAFSARNNQLNPPKSLKYILAAMEKDAYGGFGIGFNEDYLNPDLTRWANQGVLLINTALSTHIGKTGVHLDLWNPFMRTLFYILAHANTNIIYILLGAKAKLWQSAINTRSNHVLTATHPAYCAYKGLKDWDCEGIFSKTNNILEQIKGPDAKIKW